MLKTVRAQTKVAVIGLGYVGLTVVGAAASHNYEVYGYDLNEQRIKKVNELILVDNSKSFDWYLYTRLRESISRIHFSAKYDESLRAADVKVICVDTLNVPTASAKIASYIKKGDIVSVESTFGIDTCLVVKNVLEANSGLKTPADFILGFVPERVMEGRLLDNFETLPRPIGTVDRKSFKRLKEFYESLGVEGRLDFVDPLHAAAAKDFENAFRFMEISIANEFADICRERGLDFEKIKYLINCKGHGYGYNEVLDSGIGIGGPCLSMAAEIVANMSPENSVLLRNAIELNMGRTGSIAKALEAILKKQFGNLEDKKVAILGATYRPNGIDNRNSPASDIICFLSPSIPLLSVYDPLWDGEGGAVYKRLPNENEHFDAVIVLVGHYDFMDLSKVNCDFFIDVTGIVKIYPKKTKHRRLCV